MGQWCLGTKYGLFDFVVKKMVVMSERTEEKENGKLF